MGREYTVQDIKEKVLIQKTVPALFIFVGMWFLSIGLWAALMPLPSIKILPVVKFQAEGKYVPGEIIVQVKPNVNIETVVKTNLPKEQKIYQHKINGKTTSRLNPDVINNPASYSEQTTQISRRSVDNIGGPIKKIPVQHGKHDYGIDRYYLIAVNQTQADVHDLVQRFKSDDRVELAQLNLIYQISAMAKLSDVGPGDTLGTASGGFDPNDPYFRTSSSWAQSYRDQWGLPYVKIPEAWSVPSSGTRNIGNPATVIANIDSGIDYQHPELQEKIWVNGAEDSNDNGCPDYWSNSVTQIDCHGNSIIGDLNNQDDDGNGLTDDLDGMNYFDIPVGSLVNYQYGSIDRFGHGTRTAGIMVAKTDNSFGIAGVCPLCRIMPIKITDAAGQSNSGKLISAIRYSIVEQASVISMPIGGTEDSGLNNIVQAAHNSVVLVAAAGNSNQPQIEYPAAYDNVIAVGAINPDGTRLSIDPNNGSNKGRQLDLMAPGYDILSLQAANTGPDPSLIVSPGYIRGHGTSFSTALVAGIAGLVRSINPYLTPLNVDNLLLSSVNSIGNGNQDEYGRGLINAQKAVTQANQLLPDVYFPSLMSATKRTNTVRVQATVRNDGGVPARNVHYHILNGSQQLILESDIPEVGNSDALIDDTFSGPSLPTLIYIALDPHLQLVELKRDNNQIGDVVDDNRPPSFKSLMGNRAVNEGEGLTIQVDAYDPDNDPLTYSYTAAISGSPVDIGASIDSQAGIFQWFPRYDQAGLYQITFTIADPDLPQTQTIDVTVNNATPKPFVALTTGQGFANEIEDGLEVFGAWAPDYCAMTNDDQKKRCKGSVPFDIKPRQIKTSDINYIRIRFGTGGKWNAAVSPSALVDVNVRARQIGADYYFELHPNLSSECIADPYGDVYCSAYISTLKFVEQDEDGNNYGTANYTGWSTSWENWRNECSTGARGSADKNGLGVRAWSTNLADPNKLLESITFCVIDDSGGHIDPSWDVQVMLKSLNQAPVIGAMNNQIIQEGRVLSLWVPATDFNTDFMTYTATGLPAGATLDPNTGQFSWTPSFTQSGTYNVTFTANDGLVASNSRTMSITVNNVDQVPVLASIGPKTVALCGLLTFQLSVLNPDEDPLTYSMQGSPAPSAFNPATGRYTFACACSTGIYSPFYDVIFRVTDSHGNTDAETVRINIQGVPPSPGGGGGASRCEPNCDYRDYMPSYKRSVE